MGPRLAPAAGDTQAREPDHSRMEAPKKKCEADWLQSRDFGSRHGRKEVDGSCPVVEVLHDVQLAATLEQGRRRGVPAEDDVHIAAADDPVLSVLGEECVGGGSR